MCNIHFLRLMRLGKVLVGFIKRFCSVCSHATDENFILVVLAEGFKKSEDEIGSVLPDLRTKLFV